MLSFHSTYNGCKTRFFSTLEKLDILKHYFDKPYKTEREIFKSKLHRKKILSEWFDMFGNKFPQLNLRTVLLKLKFKKRKRKLIPINKSLLKYEYKGNLNKNISKFNSKNCHLSNADLKKKKKNMLYLLRRDNSNKFYHFIRNIFKVLTISKYT